MNVVISGMNVAASFQRRHIHSIKFIVRAAIIAVHFDFAIGFKHFVNIFIRQGQQRSRTTFAGTGATEADVLRFIQSNLFLMIQTVKHFVGWQGQQLFRFDGGGQLRQMAELFRISILCWQNLQQHSACSRLAFNFTGTDEDAGWQLF